MGSHQSVTHQRVLRSTSRRNNGIDEYTRLEGESCHKESLLDIANVEWNDWAFSLTNLKAFFSEALQGVLGHLPESLDTLRLLQAAAVAAGVLEAEKI